MVCCTVFVCVNSAYLASLGLEKGSMAGLYSINRPEWVIAEYGCNYQAIVTVPLYDTLGAEAIEFIINQTELSVIFTTGDKLKNLTGIASKLPTLKRIVLMDGVSEAHTKAGADANIEVLSMADAEKIGAGKPVAARAADWDDLATICYTSGTTGQPKGVMLSHGNLLSDAGSVVYLGRQGRIFDIRPDDVHISYLPLAHMFERIVMCFVLLKGAQIGFYSGDTLKLLDDISVLKPTLFISVPRLLNRVFDKVTASVEAKGGISKFLFDTAYASKKAGLANGHVTHWFWDRLVFGAVRARLGGRVRAIVTGSAPISTDVMDFLRIAFSCDVYEGYGQTESSAGSFITESGDLTAGHVGAPLPVNYVKLVDVPDMNYTSADKPYPRGEVCYRGNNITKGYFKNPEKTREDIDADGWLHSGDIGMWDEYGRLRIIDRKKNIFKLAQGEYVAPEKVENVYQKTKYVAQAYVHGDSLKASLVGIFVPDEETLLPWCKSNGIAGTKLADVIGNPEVVKMILADANAGAKASGLKGFELCRRITLIATPFSVENDILTPTFKLKRNVAKRVYQAQIDAMYAELDQEEAEAKKKLATEA
jgi:long-chain acyl-CoA synthetase